SNNTIKVPDPQSSTGASFNSLAISGNYTTAGGTSSNRLSVYGTGTLNVSGTLTASGTHVWLKAGSTMTVTGLLASNSGAEFQIAEGAVLGAGGTITGTVDYTSCNGGAGNTLIPARAYSGSVKFDDCGHVNQWILAAGNHVYNGGISFPNTFGGTATLDANVNDPNVTVTSFNMNQTDTLTVNAGTGSWTVTG